MTTRQQLTARARLQVVRFRQLVEHLTSPERTLFVALLSWLVVDIALLPFDPDGTAWLTLGALLACAFLACPVLVDALVARDLLLRLQVELAEAQQLALQAHVAKPSGAPRVAEVRCVHGDMHRFVFGPDGWEAAGPAVDSPPQEAQT